MYSNVRKQHILVNMYNKRWKGERVPARDFEEVCEQIGCDWRDVYGTRLSRMLRMLGARNAQLENR